MKRIYLTTKNFYLLFIILMLTGMIRCGNSSDDSFLVELESAPFANLSKASIPKWLVVRINDYYETRSPSICKVLIYKGEWNKQTVYFIVDTFSACLECDFFTEDGERIVDNLSDCRTTSKNWILIYEYGELDIDLVEILKN